MAYDAAFLGLDLPLPLVKPSRLASIVQSPSLTNGVLAEYPTYSVLTDGEKRAPVYSVLLIDQHLLKPAERSDKWVIDDRIGAEFQLDNAYYKNNDWDRGHMARRESAAWGQTKREAQTASDETFYYSNAALQHANVNQDEWLGLEDWVLQLDLAKNGKIVVFAGPVYGETPRIVKPAGREPAEIPAGFFKVVCFVNAKTEKLDVRAFLVFQDAEALEDKNGRDRYDYQHYQVTIREIELLTGLDFPDQVYEMNPLFFHESDEAKKHNVTSFPERVDVNTKEDLIHAKDQPRHAARDDEIHVYLIAAHIAPDANSGEEEWVSILNAGASEIDLAGWKLVDKAQRITLLDGVLLPGQAKAFTASAGLRPVLLSNERGVIVLLNDRDEHVDRIDYTKEDLKRFKDKATKKQLPVFFPTYRDEGRVEL